jgi:hypothetical protein
MAAVERRDHSAMRAASLKALRNGASVPVFTAT